ncbi:4-hydroxyphenylpyruvate dioxygenase [Klebsiella pneumoniae]|uniref:4-hydroxyphenylpyruvate dioxygenase n=1 Tax=Klebsiella pneumoniae TaxID=573 RepID=A0A2X3EME1_KLEPN|nr:4-hydroxyphenylpyruvate dioxygenase [Klebsiella pneumoniae]
MPICFSPPPLPVYHGLEFIEFAASAAEAQRLGQHLQALGFQHEGSHRSRQVTLWRNGGARIVINHQPHSWADHFYQRHGVSLCAMALRVEHSASLVARARALGVCHLAGRRRAERNADPGDLRPRRQPYLSHRTPGRLSTSAIFICVMA